eukprot:CAMPEP_0172594540 /NCGR_PEP_ID=MMETSP1068-20121228/13956_1 /TAXON_ID=35684 /ORGANISM="Pseudopedinella elastica, Strain CCMP716" /LENGTH=1535 /DNA_ID=CAMNT_0013392633 /DNA_START=209 /DNA_END=4816 /DNA_ORIENTATION=-
MCIVVVWLRFSLELQLKVSLKSRGPAVDAGRALAPLEAPTPSRVTGSSVQVWAQTSASPDMSNYHTLRLWLEDSSISNAPNLASALGQAGVGSLDQLRSVAQRGGLLDLTASLPLKKLEAVRFRGAVEKLVSGHPVRTLALEARPADAPKSFGLTSGGLASKIGDEKSKAASARPTAAQIGWKDTGSAIRAWFAPGATRGGAREAASGEKRQAWQAWPPERALDEGGYSYSEPPPNSFVRWDGPTHREGDQHTLNLVHGLYGKLNQKWLRKFAARRVESSARPPLCGASGDGASSVPKFLAIFSASKASDSNMHWLKAARTQATSRGVGVLVATTDGPYPNCALLRAARGCKEGTCILLGGGGGDSRPSAAGVTGAACLLSLGGSRGQESGGRLVVWPAGHGGDPKRRLRLFNRVEHELSRGLGLSAAGPATASAAASAAAGSARSGSLASFLGAEAAAEAAAASEAAIPEGIPISLARVLTAGQGPSGGGKEGGGAVLCLARSDHLPLGAHDTWVERAAGLLERNPKLGALSCFPKFKGHEYTDVPEYMQVAVKYAHYGLAFEECATKAARSPVSVPGPNGFWHEPFAYAPFSPYGPQCFDLREVNKLRHEGANTRDRIKQPLFRPSDPGTGGFTVRGPGRHANLSAEVDTSLRLWHGGSSVGVMDCEFGHDPETKMLPRQFWLPHRSALLEDNANAYEPTLKLEMARPLLLTGPALYKLKEPYAAISAAEILIAANIVNHGLFQRRQRILWPEATALDAESARLVAESPLPLALSELRDEAMPNASCPGSAKAKQVPKHVPKPGLEAGLRFQGARMMKSSGCTANLHDFPLARFGDFNEGMTLVLMSYAGGAFTMLAGTINHYLDKVSRRVVREVVLVWNSPLDALPRVVNETLANKRHKQAFRVVPFPVNSLMNRFHPSVAPKTRAVLFCDDDKRIPEASLRIGLAKWCCGNADRAVGAIGRRFWPSKTGIEYHTSGRMQDMQMVIPSGMILDGAYLCHIWRLEFAPLHDYVQRQPSHPDDIAINLLIQYISGKGPRVYPQVVEKPGGIPAVTRRRLRANGSLPRQETAENASEDGSALAELAAQVMREGLRDWGGEEVLPRRRLGMSGSAVWPLWRGDGAQWLANFFGGLPRIAPGYCNEGLPFAKWKHGCDSTVPTADLAQAYGRPVWKQPNRPTAGRQGPKPWDLDHYSGPKALSWLTCNSSKLFAVQERRLEEERSAVSRGEGWSWGQERGLLFSTTASAPPFSAAAASLLDENQRAQNTWDNIRHLMAMNSEVATAVVALRERPTRSEARHGGQQPCGETAPERVKMFVRDLVANKRQALQIETLYPPELASPELAAPPSADGFFPPSSGPWLFVDLLLRADRVPRGAFKDSVWLDASRAQPCRMRLIPVPWSRPSQRRPWVAWVDGRPAAAGWAFHDVVAQTRAGQRLRSLDSPRQRKGQTNQSKGRQVPPEQGPWAKHPQVAWADIREALEGWDHLVFPADMAGTSEDARAPGVCVRAKPLANRPGSQFQCERESCLVVVSTGDH